MQKSASMPTRPLDIPSPLTSIHLSKSLYSSTWCEKMKWDMYRSIFYWTSADTSSSSCSWSGKLERSWRNCGRKSSSHTSRTRSKTKGELVYVNETGSPDPSSALRQCGQSELNFSHWVTHFAQKRQEHFGHRWTPCAVWMQIMHLNVLIRLIFLCLVIPLRHHCKGSKIG